MPVFVEKTSQGISIELKDPATA